MRTCCLSAERSMKCNILDSPCEQSSQLEGEGIEARVSAGRWWAHHPAAFTVLGSFPPVVWIK